jgi:hypothetical protein
MTRKATREGLKSHNRRLVLRSVFSGEASNRAALATHTGLAKPTISDIVGWKKVDTVKVPKAGASARVCSTSGQKRVKSSA